MQETHRRRLEESIASWRLSAEHDKNQAFLSLAVFGGGIAMFAVGAVGTVSGAPEVGVPAMLAGGGLAEGGRRMIISEVESAMEMQGRVAVQEYKLEHRQ